MDLEKSFDRLDLPNLEMISAHMCLPVCTAVLQNYRNLTRLLFVDNQPSDVWLAGPNLLGVPQGCPLA
eukprot:2053046-Pyramimonas_sp.AAC.1